MSKILRLSLIFLLTSLRIEATSDTTSNPVKETELLFKPSSNNVRIKNLWPEFMAAKMGIEPAIPDNFTLLVDPNSDLYGEFFWGPKGTDTKHFQESSLLKEPILKFWLCAGAYQTGSTTFSNSENLESDLQKEGFKNVVITKSMWGMYPVLSFKGQKSNRFHAVAWIGLNHESATVLCARLVCLNKSGKVTKQDLQLWNTFIENTKQLSPPAFFTALGQDLQPGYTIVDLVGETATFIAEKRTRDNIIQLVSLPNAPDIAFSVESIDEVLMGSDWNYKKPLLKVYGKLSQTRNRAYVEWPKMVISILLKPVEEFSITKDWLNSHPKATVYQYSIP